MNSADLGGWPTLARFSGGISEKPPNVVFIDFYALQDCRPFLN